MPKKRYGAFRQAGQFLGVPGAAPDPLKPLRRGPMYHGNLPFEILTYISAYMQSAIDNGTMTVSIMQTQAMNGLTMLLECLTGMERVLATPLPLAYNIAISQITWAYILVLPFQLVTPLGWVAIPGTLGISFFLSMLMPAAAYIILGLAAIGREIENPFGHDLNDLNMEEYIGSLAAELDILTSLPPPKKHDFILLDENCPLGPTCAMPYSVVNEMSVAGELSSEVLLIREIREFLRSRVSTYRERKVQQSNEVVADQKAGENKTEAV